MPTRILNNPSPNVLMNSMRSIGYSFKTAVADIIDNSISALANEIRIFTPINYNENYVSFVDNGEGMNRDELFNAMKYGSDKENYSTQDLGRFGVGLKSASLSQCRKLTVVSKKDNILSAFVWDLDCVIKNKTRDCLELDQTEIDNLPSINELKKFEHGTLVIRENFDILYKKSNGKVLEALSSEVEETEKHLALVFHRFLNSTFKPLKIYINEDLIIGCDPFLENHPKTDSQKPSIIKYHDSEIKIQPYILPHINDLTNEDIQKLGGENSLRNGQGFYVYRNNRLIIFGTWFRLASTSLSSELFKYGRIKVDIPNTLDEERDIDIRKQNASIPKGIQPYLKRIVSNVRTKSKDKNEKRTKLTLERNDDKIWNKSLSRDQKEIYFINCESKFVKNFIDDFDDNQKSKILRFIEILSASIPYDDIYNSMCHRSINKNFDQEVLNNIVLEGINQYKRLKQIVQLSDEDVLGLLKTYEPFNNEEILKLVEERVKNGR